MLETILKSFPQNLHLLHKISVLNEFSPTELFPLIVFNSRRIIRGMLRIYGEYANFICNNPYLKNLVYKYNYGKKEKEHIFFNNMILC